MIGKNCTKNLPKSIVQAMRSVTTDDCYIIERRVKGVTGSGKENNCHINVQELVERIGGECVFGWLLERNSKLFRKGIYIWSFHSIWKTPEEKYVDVTQGDYGLERLATFWCDSHRRADMIQGTAFNNLITLENNGAVQIIQQATNNRLESGKAYWTDTKVSVFAGLEEHSGVYRLLHNHYPENRKLLLDQYGVRIEGKSLISVTGDENVPQKMLFDFSLT